jgi:hypothetical protein
MWRVDKRGRGRRQEFETPAFVYLIKLLVTNIPPITNYIWITDEVSVTNQKALRCNKKTVEAPDGFSIASKRRAVVAGYPSG